MAAMVVPGDGGGELFSITSVLQFYKSCFTIAGESCADI